MPHNVKTPEQLAVADSENFAISDYPDKIPDSTVAFAACKAVPEIVDGTKPSFTFFYVAALSTC